MPNFKCGSKSPNPGHMPSQILISYGLNYQNLSSTTNEATTKKIIFEAKCQFPGSKIYLSEISLSNYK